MGNELDLDTYLSDLYRRFGPPKPMNSLVEDREQPHFFLHRNFLGEQDLAILFNTRRCRYQCKFCALPYKATKEWVGRDLVVRQFKNVIQEVRHSLGSFERLTIANEGSVFDDATFPRDALQEIVHSARVIPNIRKVVLESRLEFVQREVLKQFREESGKRIDVLTGFETLDETLRDKVLGKREPLPVFLQGLDEVAAGGAELTAYVLFKPNPAMSDAEAQREAEASIDYLIAQCAQRGIPLIIRLNPMYLSRDTPWAREALTHAEYRPPRLSDVLALAEQKQREGVRIYYGLTSEGLSDSKGTYRGREDFSTGLLKRAIVSNHQRPAGQPG
ncbi:putative Fe-S oxidoreductase [Candidatus Paraburkholderia calva]|nr:putative Fe-S oxidoreductase [Candidatus Paraburkholderia calva]